MTSLKDKANPINGLYAALICDVQELVVEQRITNELLAENGKKHDATNVFKQEQQDGDIKSRKRTEKQNKQSAGLHVISIAIACAAFYISIAGLNNGFVIWLKGLV